MNIIFKTSFLFFVLSCLIISCENLADNEDKNKTEIKTGKVTFFNESSYRIKVHHSSFSGPVVMELSAGETKSADVRVSESQAYGTTFSVEYLYRINDGFDADSGDIFASGLDFNVQINFVIEEGKTYTRQIPQPANLEFRTAFIKLLNAHNLPVELRDVGKVLRQAGNNTVPIAPGKTGVYSMIEIPVGGVRLYDTYSVVSTMDSITVPAFTASNGVIYSFTFNGTSVTKTGEQTIVFK